MHFVEHGLRASGARFMHQSINHNRYVQQDAENTLGAALRALARVGTRTADRLDVVGEHISQYAAEQLDDA